MNGTQGIPAGGRSHSEAGVLKRIAVMLRTEAREELRLRKVGTRGAAEGKSQRKQRQAFFSLSSFWCCGFVFYRSVIHGLVDIDEIIALYESWEQSLDVYLYVNFF